MASRLKISIAETSELNEMNSFYNALHQSNRSLAALRWEFYEGPHGAGFHVLARLDGNIVGMQGIIPIKFKNHNGTYLSGKSEDTLVSPEARGQGVFAKMYEVVFQECRHRGIQFIWGYTVATKPFQRIGFKVPFRHEQLLRIHSIWTSYQHLARLDPNSTLVKKFKVYMLAVYSKLYSLRSRSSNTLLTVKEVQKPRIPKIPVSEFYRIDEDEQFLQWRLFNNPHYRQLRCYEISDSERSISGLVWINEIGQKIAFISHEMWNTNDEEKVAEVFAEFASKHLKNYDCIRNWCFSTNRVNCALIKQYKQAGFVHLKHGIPFVFYRVDHSINITPNDLILTRLSTEGVN